jgi:hypothetical protein
MFPFSCADLLLFGLSERHSTLFFQGKGPIGSIPASAVLRRTRQYKVVDVIPPDLYTLKRVV